MITEEQKQDNLKFNKELEIDDIVVFQWHHSKFGYVTDEARVLNLSPAKGLVKIRRSNGSSVWVHDVWLSCATHRFVRVGKHRSLMKRIKSFFRAELNPDRL